MEKYSIEICTDISKIPPSVWNSVVRAAGGTVFHTHEWLRAYEMGAPHQNQAYHLLAYSGNQLIGIMPTYLTRGCPRLRAHRKYVVSQETPLREPMLLAHTFYSYYGGPLVAREIRALYLKLIRSFAQLARQLNVDVYGIVNIPEQASQLLVLLKHERYAIRYLSSTMYLPISWSSFDNYLKEFRSKRRRFIKAVARKAEEQGLSVEWVERPKTLDYERLIDLGEQVLRWHGHAEVNLYPRSYLRAIIEIMHEVVRFLIIRNPAGDIISFILALDFDNRLVPWIAGIDYQSLKTYEPYHYSYYWLINFAITNGYKEIDMGRGSYRFKQRYGFKRRVLYLALNTPKQGLWPEVDRWSQDLSDNALRRYAQECADKMDKGNE